MKDSRIHFSFYGVIKQWHLTSLHITQEHFIASINEFKCNTINHIKQVFFKICNKLDNKDPTLSNTPMIISVDSA